MKEVWMIMGFGAGLVTGALLYKHSQEAKQLVNKGEKAVKQEVEMLKETVKSPKKQKPAKEKGMDFLEMLQDIYMKYGYSHEKGISVVRTGKAGAEEIQAMMKEFRANPPKELGGSPVAVIKDYDSLTLTNVAEGTTEKMDMPVFSNVLQYFTADGTKVSIRPSGTEPKIKFYIEVHDKMASADDYDAANERADKKIEAVKKDLGI